MYGWAFQGSLLGMYLLTLWTNAISSLLQVPALALVARVLYVPALLATGSVLTILSDMSLVEISSVLMCKPQHGEDMLMSECCTVPFTAAPQ